MPASGLQNLTAVWYKPHSELCFLNSGPDPTLGNLESSTLNPEPGTRHVHTQQQRSMLFASPSPSQRSHHELCAPLLLSLPLSSVRAWAAWMLFLFLSYPTLSSIAVQRCLPLRLAPSTFSSLFTRPLVRCASSHCNFYAVVSFK
eukprot:3939550-Rhodomonas_salina.1